MVKLKSLAHQSRGGAGVWWWPLSPQKPEKTTEERKLVGGVKEDLFHSKSWFPIVGRQSITKQFTSAAVSKV